MASIPALALVAFLAFRDERKPSVPSEEILNKGEVPIQAHSSHWMKFDFRKEGTFELLVAAHSVDVGIAISEIGPEGFTPAVDERMRRQQTMVPAGQVKTLSIAVRTGTTYAYLVSNETDQDATVYVTATWRK